MKCPGPGPQKPADHTEPKQEMGGAPCSSPRSGLPAPHFLCVSEAAWEGGKRVTGPSFLIPLGELDEDGGLTAPRPCSPGNMPSPLQPVRVAGWPGHSRRVIAGPNQEGRPMAGAGGSTCNPGDQERRGGRKAGGDLREHGEGSGARHRRSAQSHPIRGARRPSDRVCSHAGDRQGWSENA